MEKIIIERICVLSYNESSDIKIDSSFQDDLNFDDLDLAELYMDLEEKLKITIDYNLFYEIKTVGDLISYVKKLI
ncbi:MAG: phosphopantetheine-binding protein [Lutibacter sp.]|nr:acyl carrier protein [Lutibacter sp.]